MDEIKSALQIAMEKVAMLEEPTQDERLKWKYVPKGDEMAVRYLKEDSSILTELGQYDK